MGVIDIPLKYDGKTFEGFQALVRYVAKKKRFSLKRAGAYVAGIEKRQHPNKRSR